MTPSRKEAIGEIQLPKTIKKLRAFLGLLNYFRDHIRNYAKITALLYDLLRGNPHKSAAIPWTPEAEEVFYRCRDAAANSETLYHMGPEGEIKGIF